MTHDDAPTAQDRFRRTEAIFRQARRERDPAARAAFVQAACGDDDALRDEVEAWLAGHEAAERTGGAEATTSAGLAGAAWDAVEEESGSTPQRIGRYRIRRVIGAGGMGTVFEAEQDDPKRVVALKLLHPELDEEKLRRRFRLESEVLAQLAHDGIAHVYDVGEIQTQLGPRLFIAMERVDGTPLRDYVKQHDPDVRERVRLLRDISLAVRHAHRNGVIHRDLKPSNILVRADGSPKLLDFGVARRLDVESDLTRSGHIVGTLRYMSPEQALGAHVDSRSDVYALGVIGYELLSGVHPAQASTSASGDAAAPYVPSLGSRDSALRGDLSIIFAKALERDPDDRYGDAGELAEDLRRFLEHEPILARPKSSAYQLRMFVGRHRTLVTAAAATLAALVAGLVLALSSAAREERQRIRADRQAAEAAAAAYLASVRAATADIATADPGPARLRLTEQPEALRGWEWHYLWSRLDRSTAVLPVAPVALPRRREVEARLTEDRRLELLGQPAREFDPEDRFERTVRGRVVDARGRVLMPPRDSARLRFAVPAADAVWELTDRDVRNNLDFRRPADAADARRIGTGTRLYDVQLSPDQRTLACGGRDMSILFLDARHGRVRHIARGHTRAVLTLAFHPERPWLASGSEDGVIRFWDVERSVPVRTLLGHAEAVEQLAFLPDGSGLLSLGRATLRFWDFEAEAALDVLRRPRERERRYIYDLGVSADGRYVASMSFAGNIEVASLQTGAVLRRHAYERRYRSYPNFTVRFSPDGRYLAACEGPPHLWDARTGRLLWAKPREIKMTVLAFDMPRREILAIGEDGVYAFALADGAHRRLVAHEPRDTNLALDLSPDHARYACVVRDVLSVRTRDPDAEIWRTAAPRIVQILWSPDGTRLAAAALDGTVRLYDARSGEELIAMRGHAAPVYAVAFTPDGSRLASGAHDSTIRLWDTRTGANTLVLRGHDDYIHALAFDPSGRTLISGSGDGTVRTWSVRPFRERWAERARILASERESK